MSMTAKKAHEVVSLWGSYMTAGDPGAVFYSFPLDNAAPQSEEHRAALLAYTDSLIDGLMAEKNAEKRDTETALDLTQLRELRQFFAACPIPVLDEFTEAYVTCALWSSNDNEDERGGEPIDSNYTVADIDPEALAAMIADCAKFQADNTADLAALADDPRVHLAQGSTMLAHAGHDFWLTRVGHGAGFWDGDWPEPYAERLTKAAKRFGNCDLYVSGGKVFL